MKNNKKTILIIGGMGPTASLYAHKKLLEKYSLGNKNLQNCDYPNIIHLSINTQDFININMTEAKKSLDYIKQKIDILNLDKINTGFIACNTAHIFFDDINNICQNKLISITKLAEDKIKTKNIGLIGTPFTLKNNIYKTNSRIIIPNSSDLLKIEGIIRNIISNTINIDIVKDFENIINNLKNNNCEQIIIGCTELSILTNMIKDKYQDGFLLDPVQLIVDEIVGCYE